MSFTKQTFFNEKVQIFPYVLFGNIMFTIIDRDTFQNFVSIEIDLVLTDSNHFRSNLLHKTLT